MCKAYVLAGYHRLMLHDPDVYPDPFEFRPERFYDPILRAVPPNAQRDPRKIAFGFGRRCEQLILK